MVRNPLVNPSPMTNFISLALVAIRVFALHNGRSWIRKFLWCSGILYFLSTMAVVTLGAIPVVGELLHSDTRTRYLIGS